MPQTPAARATAVTYQVASGQAVRCGDTGAVAPVAEFIGSPTSGTVPFTVTFTNQSTGVYSAQAWSFGDGGTSTSANPTRAYTAAGTYTVTLTLTWAGGTVTRTRTAYVTGSASSVADTATLSLSPTGTTGAPTTGTVTLNGTSPAAGSITISGAGATITPGTLSWSSGEAGTAKSVTVQRATDGTTSVSLSSGIAGVTAGAAVSHTTSAAVVGTPSPFTLTSSTSGTLPFTVGHAFRQGDIPAGSGIAIAGATAQATIKNAWPDGSAKFAIIAGSYTSAGSAATVTPSAGTASTGTALTTTDLIATGITASIDAGAFGAASFGNTEWAAPFQAWVSGHRMSSWIFRKQIGSDAHLVAWLEVRLYLGGAVEVLPWVENGYLNVASPTSKSAVYSFTLGGTLRNGGQTIDIPHHCRTPLVAGSPLSYWLSGTDPGVTVKHDAAYLQATELVPTYSATIDPASSMVTGLPATFVPLQQGSYTYQSDIMSNTGYASPIGLLPQHDALYLMASSGVWASVQRNAYSAGRYPIHWRDETTNRPPAFASYTTLAIGSGQGVTNTGNGGISTFTPAVSGTTPPQWDLAHCPSVGYVAYLLTGRWYHMETAQFAAVTNHLHQGANIRGTGSGVIRSFPGANDTRHAAWGIRTLWQALTVTPDADTAVRPTLKASLQATIDFHHARYVAQAHNPLGFTEPGADYFGSQSSTYGDRLWMQDFSVASWGYMRAAQPTLDSGYSTKIAAFFDWHAPAIVGRLGDPDDTNAWPINNPAHYNGAVAASDSPDWAGGTGPWYSTFRAAYNATILTPPGWLSTNNLILGAEIQPGANSYLGNLLPGIAYAVRHGSGGAQAAYRRLQAMQGYGLLIQDLQTTPVWGVKPASGALPSWLTAGTFAWQAIPTSTLAGSAAGIGSTPGDATAPTTRLLAYSGISKRGTEVWTIATGGHNDSADNGARKLDIGVDSPAWAYPKASDWNGSENTVAYYASGSPASRHSHRSTFWVPQRSRFLLFGCRATWGGTAASFTDVASFNPSPSGYDAQGTRAAVVSAITIFDPVTGIGFGSSPSSGGQIVRFNATADTHTITAGGSIGYMPTGAYDTKRSQAYYLGWGDGEAGGSGVVSRKVSSNGVTVTNITLSGAGATAFAAAAPSYGTMVYDPVVDCFWWWDGISRQLFKIVPDNSSTWVCTAQSISGTPPVVSQYSFSRMEYVPELGGLVFMPTGAHPMQFVRTF